MDSNSAEVNATGLEQRMASTSLEPAAGTSNTSSLARNEEPAHDQLPKGMNEMKIKDEKAINIDDKVDNFFLYFIEVELFFHFKSMLL